MKPTEEERPPSDADWERLAEETFAERKKNVGRVPDRRRAATPPWYPPGTEPQQD